MRVLITGASGFAGGWLALACARAGDEVTGVSRSGATPAGDGVAVVAPGAYNISSGHSVSVAENTQTVAELHLVDPARVRSGEVIDRSGSFDKLRDATGWEPRIPLQATIADSIDWWQAHLRSDGRGNTGPDHREYS